MHHRFRKPLLHRNRRRGFTLLEIIVVVTIIALLAGIVIPRLWARVGTAKTAAAESETKAIAAQVVAFMLDAGLSRPDDDFDLEMLLLAPEDGGGSNGPYLQKADDLLDPWGNRYDIIIPGEVNYDFDVISYGADGQPGGEGENADITN
jgi:general secretion pathway protein G